MPPGRVLVRRQIRRRRQDPAEDLDRLLHLFHRPERDAGVGLLHRREVAPDTHTERQTRVTELARRPPKVDEDMVGVRIGGLVPQLPERLEREITDASVLCPLVVDVPRVPQRRDPGRRRQRVDAAFENDRVMKTPGSSWVSGAAVLTAGSCV